VLKEVASGGPVEIVFFYAHADREFVNLLKTQIDGLGGLELITWNDDDSPPGAQWQLEIEAHLRSARIIALLVSADFLLSPWCQSETDRALARSSEKGTIVVPIIARGCLWRETRLGKLTALPADGRPLVEWPELNAVCASVAESLLRRSRQLDGRAPASTASVPEERFDNLALHERHTSFIGRRNELARVKDLLRVEGKRLVALVGSSGMGKSRLAWQVAAALRDELRNGVCFVPLDQVKDADLVIPTIAKVLGMKEREGAPVEQGEAESSTNKRLKSYLSKRQMLLVLDSFEHVLSAGGDVFDLLRECHEITIVLTSTCDPNISGAQTYEVPLLQVPGPGEYRLENVQEVDSIALFLEIARNRCGFVPGKDDMPHVVEICTRVQGVPLAIELAAAQARLPLPEIVAELDNQLRLLVDDAHGVAERHKGMHAAIRWSYDLLGQDEKELFSRTSVFAGSFTLRQAKEVCNAEGMRAVNVMRGINNLLKGSFLHKREQAGELRFKLLRVFQEYARELLQDARPFERQHALTFLSLAEAAELKLTSSERGNWLERLDADYPNLLSALSWCRAENEIVLGLRLAGALSWYWNFRASFQEGRSHLETLLKEPSHDTRSRAKAFYGLGMLVFLQGDFELAIEKLEESVALWKDLDQRRLGAALIVLGMAASSLGRFPLARECEEKSIEIFDALHDKWWRALARNDLGNVYRAQGDLEQSLALYQASRKLWEEMQDDWGLPLTLSNLGFLEMQKGNREEEWNYEKSRAAFERALEIQKSVKDRWGQAETVKYLADLAVREDNGAEATRLYLMSLSLNRMIGRRPFVVGCLAGITVLAERRRQVGDAARLAGFVDQQRQKGRVYAKPIDHPMYERAALASYDRQQERQEGAEMSLEEAIELALRISAGWLPGGAAKGADWW
jgi:predicted ATPase